MSPLMKGIAPNKLEKVKIARTLLDVNKELTLKHQFGYVLRQLLTVKEWFCTMTQHKYEGVEILVVYMKCFKMLVQDDKEYQSLVEIAEKTIDGEDWKQLVEYGLDHKDLIKSIKTLH